MGYVKGQRTKGMKIDFIDVRRTYFHAKAKRRVFVNLPAEDSKEGYGGEICKSMYGTRDAAQNWEAEYIEFLEGTGFKRGHGSPCVFAHLVKNLTIVVHGDDFTVLGHENDLGRNPNKSNAKYY